MIVTGCNTNSNKDEDKSKIVSLRKLTFSDFSYQKLSLFSSLIPGQVKDQGFSRCWLVH